MHIQIGRKPQAYSPSQPEAATSQAVRVDQNELAFVDLHSLRRIADALAFTGPSKAMPKDASFEQRTKNLTMCFYQRAVNTFSMVFAVGSVAGFIGTLRALATDNQELLNAGWDLGLASATSALILVGVAHLSKLLRERNIASAVRDSKES